jgi:hypothetical protein
MPFAWAFFILSTAIVADFEVLRLFFSLPMKPKKHEGGHHGKFREE